MIVNILGNDDQVVVLFVTLESSVNKTLDTLPERYSYTQSHLPHFADERTNGWSNSLKVPQVVHSNSRMEANVQCPFHVTTLPNLLEQLLFKDLLCHNPDA